MQTIHKIAGIAVKDDAFFMVRKKGKDIWTSLGGKPEGAETEEETLQRECKEEINCSVNIIRKLGDFEAKAAFDDALVRLSTYLVEIKGTPEITDNELEECAYISEDYKKRGIKLTEVMEGQIIPFCIKEGILKWVAN